MANNERLTKRVKKIEEWIAENDGGDTLSNMNFLIHVYRDADDKLFQLNRERQMLNSLMQEYFEKNELLESWNDFIKEKDDAVQKQQTEEVSVQEEAESSKEVSVEEKDDKK